MEIDSRWIHGARLMVPTGVLDQRLTVRAICLDVPLVLWFCPFRFPVVFLFRLPSSIRRSLSDERHLLASTNLHSVSDSILFSYPCLQRHDGFGTKRLLHWNGSSRRRLDHFSIESTVVKACGRRIIARCGVVNPIEP